VGMLSQSRHRPYSASPPARVTGQRSIVETGRDRQRPPGILNSSLIGENSTLTFDCILTDRGLILFFRVTPHRRMSGGYDFPVLQLDDPIAEMEIPVIMRNDHHALPSRAKFRQ